MNRLNFTASKYGICHFARLFQRPAVANIIPGNFKMRRLSCFNRRFVMLKLKNNSDGAMVKQFLALDKL
jgi:hypothetical protein